MIGRAWQRRSRERSPYVPTFPDYGTFLCSSGAVQLRNATMWQRNSLRASGEDDHESDGALNATAVPRVSNGCGDTPDRRAGGDQECGSERSVALMGLQPFWPNEDQGGTGREAASHMTPG